MHLLLYTRVRSKKRTHYHRRELKKIFKDGVTGPFDLVRTDLVRGPSAFSDAVENTILKKEKNV
jgi:hypothetical protein